jgi:cell shape-determining protein MreD
MQNPLSSIGFHDMKVVPIGGEFFIKVFFTKNKENIKWFFKFFLSLYLSLFINKISNGELFPILFLIPFYSAIERKKEIPLILLVLYGLIYDSITNAPYFCYTLLFCSLYFGSLHLQKHLFQKKFFKNWLSFSIFCFFTYITQTILYGLEFTNLFEKITFYFLMNNLFVWILFPFYHLKIKS